MKFLLASVFFIFPAWPSLGQQTLDSLNQVLREKNLHDTSKVHVYSELSWEWAGKDPKVGLRYADSAFYLAQTIRFESGKIAALNRRGVNYWYSGQDSLAVLAYEEVLAYHQQHGNLKGQATTINNIALLHYNGGEYRLALENHQQASRIFEQLDLRKNLINSLSNEGVVFLALSDYPRALELFLKALAKTEDEDAWEKGNLLNNLGLVYKNLNELEKAKSYYHQGLDHYRKTGNQQSEALALGNLSTVTQLQKDFTKAQFYLEKALQINRKIGNPRRIASDFSSMGNLLLAQNQPNRAHIFLDSARILYQNLEENLGLSSVLLQLAQTKEKLGENLRTLLELEQKALRSAQKSGSLDAQQSAWLALSKREEQLGDFSQSLASFRQATLFKDSIFNRDNEKKLMRAQLGYEYDLREKDLKAGFDIERSLLESEKQREQLKAGLFLLGIVAVLMISGLVVYFLRRQNQVKQEKLEAGFRARMTELELKALKAQMNPHFIFNALSSISNFLLKNQAQEADRYLTKFSRLIRRILEYTEVKEISVVEEIDLLRDYIALEALRLGKEVDFQINNPEELDLNQVMIPPLLLQPLVENSLWHGISKSDLPGVIKLGIHPQPDCLILTLRDNGGSERESVKLTQKATSMGMGLVKSRLENLLSTQSEDSWTLLWEKLTDGFEVKVKLAKPAL